MPNRTSSGDAYTAAVSLIHDPRPTWGEVPAPVTYQLRRILASLVSDIDWLRIQLALTPGEASALECDRADTFERRIERVIELHPRVADIRGAAQPMCGACAEQWPCRTILAAEGHRS